MNSSAICPKEHRSIKSDAAAEAQNSRLAREIRKARAILGSESLLQQLCRMQFRQFDTDSNGWLDVYEIQNLVADLCSRAGVPVLDHDVVSSMLASVDKTQYNALNQEEFVDFFKAVLGSIVTQCEELLQKEQYEGEVNCISRESRLRQRLEECDDHVILERCFRHEDSEEEEILRLRIWQSDAACHLVSFRVFECSNDESGQADGLEDESEQMALEASRCFREERDILDGLYELKDDALEIRWLRHVTKEDGSWQECNPALRAVQWQHLSLDEFEDPGLCEEALVPHKSWWNGAPISHGIPSQEVEATMRSFGFSHLEAGGF